MHYILEELKDGEVWIGNTSRIKNFPPKHLQSLQTIRLGNVALDIHGKKIDTNYCRPLFLNKSEMAAYDKIMTNPDLVLEPEYLTK